MAGDAAVHRGGPGAGEAVAGGPGHHAVRAAVPQRQHAPGPHHRLPGEGRFNTSSALCSPHFWPCSSGVSAREVAVLWACCSLGLEGGGWVEGRGGIDQVLQQCQ